MIKEAIASAATIEAAIEAAKRELAAPEDAELVTEVLEAPAKKTLGLFGGTLARVRVYYEESEFAKAEEYLKNILRLMDVQASVLTVREDEGVRFAVECEGDYGCVIGRRGETLDALQYLTRLIVSRNAKDYQRVIVNVGDYREQREQSLQELATRSAAKAKKTGRNVSLAPMSPYDRRILHTVVQEIDGVSSFSVGDGSDRHVVVAPGEAFRRNERPGFNRENRGRGPQGGRDYNNNRGYANDRPRRDSGDRWQPRDGSRAPGGGQGYRNAGSPPAQQAPPNRPPRSERADTGRYSKIAPSASREPDAE
ncbi:MAG: KH domain-containing protein [Oscillospiraceae bacterium]|jgi:spoIIIJ-associated protein|nr:KH domain-containing protein [Oscillospiraceae bacterium]